MNLERKNTLFIVSLVFVVLASVATLSYFLIRRHVEHELVGSLDTAHAVFVEAQKQRFDHLFTMARRLSTAPPLVSASLTGDVPTIEGALRELAPSSRVDLTAFYRGAGRGNVAADAVRSYLASPQLLASAAFRDVARRADRDGNAALGHALVFDTLLQLVAVPVENPVGGRLGVLLLGHEIGREELARMRDLVRAEILLYDANLVLGSTMEALNDSPESLSQPSTGSMLAQFSAADRHYYGRSYPILDRRGGTAVAQLLLAIERNQQWQPYELLARTALSFALGILFLAVILGIWISRHWLTKPIRSLARVTAAIGHGDMEVEVDDGRNDELGQLASSFNRMLRQLKESRAEEHQSRQRFHDFAESTSDWLWETDAAGRFTYVSANVGTALGFTPEEFLERDPSQVFAHDEMGEFLSLLRASGRKVRPIKDYELWVTTREGFRLCLRMNAKPYFQEDAFCGFRGTARDITKAKHDQERLVHLANRDHLTGLSNRRQFMDDLVREIERARRQDQMGAVLLIDLDHFKLVNDTAGHAAGDEVIIQMAGLLRGLARNIDLVARLSGDEFAVALLNVSPEQASRRADEILNFIRQLRPTYGGKILNTSATIGIVTFPEHGTNPVELLAKADTAMYAAKRAGRNRSHLYTEGDADQEQVGSQLTWKERIHDALQHDLFELAFQPIVPATGGPAQRYEVLARMRVRGQEDTLYNPGSFIPTAEQFGLIHQVDVVILGKAIQALAGLPNSNVSFAINLSGLSVGDDEVMRRIQRELENTRIDRHRLVFEVTETAACQNINRAMEFIGRIRDLGCRIALDDFGVGFSSFSYLKHLNVDIIKIDGSFIRDIHNSREDQLFVKALVDVARGLGIQTVAEFVENEQALAMVRNLGIDYVQGHHVGRPHSVPELRQAVGA